MAGVFSEAFKGIANAISDFSSLEVTTYKGTVKIAGTGLPTNFDDILAKASAEANFKLLASTKAQLDKDTTRFFDESATAEEKAEHNQLFESAKASRQAIVDLFTSAITKDLT